MNLAAKNIFLFLLLLTLALLVNQPIITYGMVYPEEATIYLANQTIHSWGDLLNIYLHPTWLNKNIPFFRPSGHFLIYQLLTPLLGWHNTFSFYLISFSFLALTGFFIIKLYKLLFPSFAIGGWLAFSLYLMHPSLMISRMTFMHFDFSYVAFVVLSLYLFVLFCQSPVVPSVVPRRRTLFTLSLSFFAIAVTFKEPAIMLGPVLFFYYCISCEKQRLFTKQSFIILFSIFAVSAFLSWYLFLSWPSMQYAANKFNLSHTLQTANIAIKDIFGIGSNLIPYGRLPYEQYAFRTTLFTTPARLILWLCFWLTLAAMIFSKDRKSLLFLFVSALLFTVLPLCWASGGPWHQSLTLVCLSMMMGFAAEYYLKRFDLIIFISGIIAIIGVTVNTENLIKYNLEQNGLLGMSINGKAVLSPPDIKNKLNDDSLLIVEDSILHNDYFLGNSTYPFFLFFTKQDYDVFRQREQNFYFRFHPVYGGNLFKYAYLMPNLKEQLYPFQIEAMDDIPNEIIYDWLKHYKNIFCVGYDAFGNWRDKTDAFKSALSKQQARRQLVINDEQSQAIRKKMFYTKA